MKRFLHLIILLGLTATMAMAQAIAPRCRVCGKKIVDCPYKGNHTAKRNSERKPVAVRKCTVCGLPVNRCEYKGHHPKHVAHSSENQTDATVQENATTNKPYQVMDDHTVYVGSSEGVEQYLKECQVPSKLKV